MPKSSVEITFNNLGPVSKAARRQASQVVRDTGEEMVRIEYQLSRVSDIDEPGYVHMRDAWAFEMEDDLTGVNYNPVPHAAFNEYGTVKMTAQPMMHPAIDHVTPSFVGRLSRIFDE